jgi:hypothetical protein
MIKALLLFAGSLAAQPSTFFGAGAGYFPAGSPKTSASACLGILVQQSSGLYSYSCYNSRFYQSKPVVTTETGAMLLLRCFSTVCLMASGTAGIASGDKVTGAYTVGGALVWAHRSGFTIVFPLTWETAGGVANPEFRILLGWSK